MSCCVDRPAPRATRAVDRFGFCGIMRISMMVSHAIRYSAPMSPCSPVMFSWAHATRGTVARHAAVLRVQRNWLHFVQTSLSPARLAEVTVSKSLVLTSASFPPSQGPPHRKRRLGPPIRSNLRMPKNCDVVSIYLSIYLYTYISVLDPCHAAVQPPSMEMFAPVICEAASVQRKTASAATWSRAKNIMPWTTGNAQQSR